MIKGTRAGARVIIVGFSLPNDTSKVEKFTGTKENWSLFPALLMIIGTCQDCLATRNYHSGAGWEGSFGLLEYVLQPLKEDSASVAWALVPRREQFPLHL